MAKFTKDFLNKVKEVDIYQVASRYFDLQKDGSNYKASCSHGSDSSPSLYFYTHNNSFYCFGCHAGKTPVTSGSDIIALVMWAGEKSFQDAVSEIAEVGGLTPEVIETTKPSIHQSSYDRLIEENRLYWKALQMNPEALEYLNKRGIGSKEIDEWRIGFVPEDSDNIHKGKIAFSLIDEYKRTVGFSYRDMSGILNNNSPASAKYINSKSSEIFSKSTLLYGYQNIKTSVEKDNYIIIGEGYTDAILAQKLGLPFVSLMGTSMSAYQASIITSNFENIILWMDGDKPGIEAMLRHYKVLSESGGIVRSIVAEDKDPNDVLLGIDRLNISLESKKKAVSEFVINNAKLSALYEVEQITSLYHSRVLSLKLHTLRELQPIVDKIPSKDERRVVTNYINKSMSIEDNELDS